MTPVQPDPAALNKIIGIQKKISNVINQISYRISKIPLPDGDQDLLRRQQRVMEFSIRISRNYLYDLGRQVADIQRHVNIISSDAKLKLTRRGVVFHMQAIEQKLINTHQLLLHALSAYCQHIPSSVIKGQPGKLKEIFQIVIDLQKICTQLHLSPELVGAGDENDELLGTDTEHRCSAILSKLRLNSENESHSQSCTNRSKKRSNRTLLSKRLSMYCADLRLHKSCHAKKSTSSFVLSRSRVHSAGAKRTMESITYMERPHTSPVKSSKESNCSKAKITIPPKEDDILTMMDIMPSDSEAGSSIDSQPLNIVSERECGNKKKLSSPSQILKTNKEIDRFEEVCDTTLNNVDMTKKGATITNEHLSDLVPVIADLMSFVANKKQSDSENKIISPTSMNTLAEFLQKYYLGKNDDRKSKSENEPKEFRTGVRNMQLISIPYTESKKTNNDKLEKNCNKITLLTVPESVAANVLQYHHQYQGTLKSSPMYTSSSQNKPWEVVSWISDNLVEELIAEVAEDLQMEDVVKKLYELEFQEL